MARRLPLACAALLFITACTSGRNVLYGDGLRVSPGANGGDIVRVYFDRYGALYPDAMVNIPNDSLQYFYDGDRVRHLSLEAYFKRRFKTPAWVALDNSVGGIPPQLPVDSAWAEIQSRIRAGIVAQLKTQLTNGRPLVVLVHGFNNTRQEVFDVYDTVRTHIRTYVQQPVYLDVYWDGLTKKPLGIWGNAQYNFPLTGLELRRILNQLDSTTPVRIFTHSSGGPLVASMMGDASAPLPLAQTPGDDSAYQHYQRHVADTESIYKPPFFLDYRIAMVVPAAAVNTFERFGARDRGPSRLILGLNTHDVAISKAIFGCGAFGSTCLSDKIGDACNSLPEHFSKSPSTKVYVLDFQGSKGWNNSQGIFWDEHAWTAYLKRDEMTRMLSLLFKPGDAGVESIEKKCPATKSGAP